MEKINMAQCQALTKELGLGEGRFNLCGPKGKLKAKWLDVHMGFFETEGQEGFLMMRDFLHTDIWCENLRHENDEEDKGE